MDIQDFLTTVGGVFETASVAGQTPESPQRTALFSGTGDEGLGITSDTHIEPGQTHVDGDFTLTGFIKNTDLDAPGGGGRVFCKGPFTTEDVHMFSIYTQYTNPNGLMFFKMSDGTNFYSVVTANGAITHNTWHFFEITFDGSTGTLSLAIDRGTPVTATSVQPMHNLTADVRVGGGSLGDGINDFKGSISCLGVWDRVLSSGELDEIYNSGVGVLFTSLTTTDDAILYYELDEESGTRNAHGVESDSPLLELSAGTVLSSTDVPS